MSVEECTVSVSAYLCQIALKLWSIIIVICASAIRFSSLEKIQLNCVHWSFLKLWYLYTCVDVIKLKGFFCRFVQHCVLLPQVPCDIITLYKSQKSSCGHLVKHLSCFNFSLKYNRYSRRLCAMKFSSIPFHQTLSYKEFCICMNKVRTVFYPVWMRVSVLSQYVLGVKEKLYKDTCSKTLPYKQLHNWFHQTQLATTYIFFLLCGYSVKCSLKVLAMYKTQRILWQL